MAVRNSARMHECDRRDAKHLQARHSLKGAQQERSGGAPVISPLLLASLPLALNVASTASETPSTFPKQLDLSVPASAATDILGVSASNVKQGANLQDLTGSLINSFDKSGHLKQGFALTSSLKQLGIGGKPSNLSFHRYFNDIGVRMHWASNLSFAAVKGSSSDDPSARVAIALSIPLIDHTDWRANDNDVRDYSLLLSDAYGHVDRVDIILPDQKTDRDRFVTCLGQCVALSRGKWLEDTDEHRATVADCKKKLDDAIQSTQHLLDLWTPSTSEASIASARDAALQALGLVSGASPDNVQDLINDYHREASIDSVIDEFVKKRNEVNWNKRKFDVSLATTWFAADAATDGLKSDGTYAWANYSDALGQDGKITLYGKYATKDRSFDAKAKLWNVGNARAFGASYRHKSGAFLEYMSSTVDAPSGKKTDIIWQGGWEFKVNGDQWVQVAMGKGSGSGVSRNILGINWTFNLSPTSTLKAK